ncbi:MAG: Crp/Fnr family transcriptional regulator [Mediterranea massiliensis]|nr:Crp/Fnr family transcriptional regulator [Mediterranea massiliensis]
MNTMYDTLLLLPLFQGMTKEDFTRILEKNKLDFKKLKAGEELLHTGDAGNKLLFVLKGEVAITTTSKENLYMLTEYISEPFLIEPQALFGMNPNYVSTYTAITDVHTISIGKSAVIQQLFNYEIFRLNYQNIICNRTQQLQNRLWATTDNQIEKRIAHFIRIRCEHPFGKKTLKVKMEDLASLLNESRLTISRALNNMQQQGLIELFRGCISIPAIEKLDV